MLMNRSTRRPVPGHKIEDGLHVIGLSKGMKGAYVKGGYSKCYLFEDGDRLTLVDAIFDSDAQQIIDYLWSIGRSPSELTDIVLTHSHRSHIGGAATLKRLSKARVWCHPDEVDIIEGKRKGAPIALRPLRPFSLYPIRVMSYLSPPLASHVSCEVDCPLEEGDRVGSLEVLHLPGHTPGNLALVWKKRAFVVADAILTWPKFGPGWPGFNTDEALYRTSLARLVELGPGIVCVAHGEPMRTVSPEELAELLAYAAR